MSLSACVSLLSLSVCVSLVSDALETIEVIITKLGMVLTASDMAMHHVLIILTLTFIHTS